MSTEHIEPFVIEPFVDLLQKGKYAQARSMLPETSRDVADGVIALAAAFGDVNPNGAVGEVCVHAVTNIIVMHADWKTERARLADQHSRLRGAPMRRRDASTLRVSLMDVATFRR